MKRSVHFMLLLLPSSGMLANAQAVPNVQGASSYLGFHLPTVGGSLSYAVTVSGDGSTGYYGNNGVSAFTSVSGDLAYLSKSKRHPFSLVYSGGYVSNIVGDGPSNLFQNLAVSQVLSRGRWNFVVSDSISYLPQTASTGLSGIPGVGDTGIAPVDVGTGTGLGVLTNNQSRIANTLVGSADRRLTASTSLAATGSYGILHFLGDSAVSLNSRQYSAGGNLNHRIDARTSVGGGVSYSHDTYPGSALVPLEGTVVTSATGYSFSSTATTVNFSRLVSRKLSVSGSVGPQWTSTSGVSQAGTPVNVSASAALSYASKATGASLNYSRGTNSGSGVVTGAQADSLSASATRRLNRTWNGSTSLGYSRLTSLLSLGGSPFVSNSLVGTAQLNRAIGRQLSAFGSYTAQRQSTQGIAAASSVFSGLSQTFAAGLTYSPGVIGLSRR